MTVSGAAHKQPIFPMPHAYCVHNCLNRQIANILLAKPPSIERCISRAPEHRSARIAGDDHETHQLPECRRRPRSQSRLSPLIPTDIEVSVGHLPSHDAFYVLATRPPRIHRMNQVVYPGSLLVCWLQHEAGVTWPTAGNLVRLQAALQEAGGAAVLQFATLADATECMARLKPAS